MLRFEQNTFDRHPEPGGWRNIKLRPGLSRAKFKRACMATRRLALALGFTFTLPACLELESSPYDTSNGGLLGALITVLGVSADPSVFLAFTDQTHFFESTGNGVWERVDFTGATGSVRQVKSDGGDLLWGLDANATNNIVRSNDFGKTWTAVNVAAEAFATLDICGTTIFSTFVNGTNYRTAYSNDSGTTWNLTDIVVGAAATTQDAMCLTDNTLLAAKNNSPHVQRSTNGGAAWLAGGALVGAIGPVRIASRTGTNEVLVISQTTCPRSNLSTDGAQNYAAADSTTFSCLNWTGALTADANQYYVGMRNAGNCELYTNPNGAAGNYSMISTSCTAGTNLTHAAVGNGAVLFGGNDSGAPRLFRHDTTSASTFQDTLPTSGATMLTDILFVP
ncbi:MAG: hypothetical protein RIF32_06490 [Leptospirales bacterium]|jgi:hypothetical protein